MLEDPAEGYSVAEIAALLLVTSDKGCQMICSRHAAERARVPVALAQRGLHVH